MLQTLAKIYLKAEEAEQAQNIIEQAMKLADEQKVGARMGWLKDGTSFRTYDDSCMKSNVMFDCKLKSRELTQGRIFFDCS